MNQSQCSNDKSIDLNLLSGGSCEGRSNALIELSMMRQMIYQYQTSTLQTWLTARYSKVSENHTGILTRIRT